MEKSLAVANFFIKKGVKENKPVTPMKLQKLVYFSHGWHLSLYKEPLIDEAVQAWQYGPVVPTIYHTFKSCGDGQIKEPYKDLDEGGPVSVNDEKTEFLNTMWNVYSDLTAVQLSNLTHKLDTPWDAIYKEYQAKNLPVPKGLSISDEKIKEYFDNEYKTLEKA